MGMATNLGAYEDCVDLMERALKAKRGIRIARETYGEAHNLFTRLHYTRKLLRDKSMGMLPSDHQDYNTTPYDILIVRRPRIIDDVWWVYIEQRGMENGIVEELDANTTIG